MGVGCNCFSNCLYQIALIDCVKLVHRKGAIIQQLFSCWRATTRFVRGICNNGCMKKIAIFILVVILLITGSLVVVRRMQVKGPLLDLTSDKPPRVDPTDPTGANLLFASGFEEPVFLEDPILSGREWVQFLKGDDRGYAWPDDVPDASSKVSFFTYLTSPKNNPLDFISTRLETVPGRNGRLTRALFMEFKKDDPQDRINARNQYSIFPGGDMSQQYVRYWIMLQPNLEEIMPPGVASFRQIMEWKEDGPPGERADYRWNIFLRRGAGKSDRIEWVARSEFGDLKKAPVDWQYRSQVPVPIGEWFLLEVFWKHQETNGRLWAAVNGQTIVDHRGRTKKDSSSGVWWPFKVYVGDDREITKRGSLYQWIDDIEFYRNIP